MRESVIYQEIHQEGRQEGKQEGRQQGKQEGKQEEGLTIVLLLLEQRLGQLPNDLPDRLSQLNLNQLEALACCFADTARVALLNISTLTELEAWLETGQS